METLYGPLGVLLTFFVCSFVGIVFLKVLFWYDHRKDTLQSTNPITIIKEKIQESQEDREEAEEEAEKKRQEEEYRRRMGEWKRQRKAERRAHQRWDDEFQDALRDTKKTK